MVKMKGVSVSFIVFFAQCLLFTPRVFADPDPALMVYPIGITTYYYDGNEYVTVGPGHPKYDPKYDRRGEVLLEKRKEKIPFDVYQANPVGFKKSEREDIPGDGYYVDTQQFTLIVDGWSNRPTTFQSVYLYVDKKGLDPDSPSGKDDECFFDLTVNGVKYTKPYLLGDISVTTPQGSSHAGVISGYTGVISAEVQWTGSCGYLTFGAFIDENGNGNLDSSEKKAPGSHDTTSHDPVATSYSPLTWGTLKTVYR